MSLSLSFSSSLPSLPPPSLLSLTLTLSLIQNCDLRGCDLQHANLRGANLAGVNFADITAPLHMSQTVNVNVSQSVSPTENLQQGLENESQDEEENT